MFWCARIASGSGSNSGTNRFRPSASIPGDDRQPLCGHPRVHAVHRGGSRHSARTGNRSRSWSRRASWGTASASGAPTLPWVTSSHSQCPAPARTADHALVGLDLDLDVGPIPRRCSAHRAARTGLRRTHPAAGCAHRCAHRARALGCGRGRTRRFILKPQLALRARLVGMLALAAVERPRQHRPGRTKPLKLDLKRLDALPRRPFAPWLGRAFWRDSDLIVAIWRRDLRRTLRSSASATDSDFDNVFLTARSPASSDSSAFLIARSLAGRIASAAFQVSNSRMVLRRRALPLRSASIVVF